MSKNLCWTQLEEHWGWLRWATTGTYIYWKKMEESCKEHHHIYSWEHEYQTDWWGRWWCCSIEARCLWFIVAIHLESGDQYPWSSSFDLPSGLSLYLYHKKDFDTKLISEADTSWSTLITATVESSLKFVTFLITSWRNEWRRVSVKSDLIANLFHTNMMKYYVTSKYWDYLIYIITRWCILQFFRPNLCRVNCLVKQ